MKKFLLLFTMTLILAFTGRAADFVLDVTSTGYSYNDREGENHKVTLTDGQSVDDLEITDGVIQIKFVSENGNAPTYNASKSVFNLYEGNRIIISRSDGNLSNITFKGSKTLHDYVQPTTSASISGNKWQNGNVSEANLVVTQNADVTLITVNYNDASDTGYNDPMLVWTAYNDDGSLYSVDEVTVKAGDFANVYLASNNELYDFHTVTYRTSDETVATAQNNYITAVEPGDAVITAGFPGNSVFKKGSASIIVHVIPADATMPPVFKPGAGIYDPGEPVLISCEEDGAELTVSFAPNTPADFENDGTYAWFTLTENVTVTAYCTKNGVESEHVTVSYKVKNETPTPVAPAAPTFSLAGGTYNIGTEATITSENGSELFVTYEPQDAVDVVSYGNPAKFTLKDNVSVTAYCTKDGLTSTETTANYSVNQCEAPTADVNTGATLTQGDKVTFTSTTYGATINLLCLNPEVTVNGTTPFTYTFDKPGEYQLSVWADGLEGYKASKTVTYTYTVEPEVVVPVEAAPKLKIEPIGDVELVDGNYQVKAINGKLDVKVTLEEGNPEAEIYYTLDARRAHGYNEDKGDHRTKHDATLIAGQSLTIEDVQEYLNNSSNNYEVTLNVHAVNNLGSYTTSATFSWPIELDETKSYSPAPKRRAEATTSWEKVTSASDIKAGDYVVITTTGFVMTSTQNDKARAAVAWDGTGTPPNEAAIFEIKPGINVSGIQTYALLDGLGYLYTKSSNGLYTNSDTPKSGTQESSYLTFNETDKTFKFAEIGNRIIGYNTSTKDFRTYSATSTSVKATFIYKKVTTGGEDDPDKITIYYDNSATNWNPVVITVDGEDVNVTKETGFNYLYKATVNKDATTVTIGNGTVSATITDDIEANHVYKCEGNGQPAKYSCVREEYFEPTEITIYYDNSATKWESVILNDGDNVTMTKVDGFNYLYSATVLSNATVTFGNGTEVSGSVSDLVDGGVYKCEGNSQPANYSVPRDEYEEQPEGPGKYVWKKVESASKIKAKDEIIIVAEDGDTKYIMGSPNTATSDWDGKTVGTNNIITVEKSGDNLLLHAATGYLKHSGTGISAGNASDGSKASFVDNTIQNKTYVLAKLTNSTDTRYICLYQTKPDFRAYKDLKQTGSVNAYVWKKVLEPTEDAKPITIYYDNSATKWESVTINDGSDKAMTKVEGYDYLYEATEIMSDATVTFGNGTEVSGQVSDLVDNGVYKCAGAGQNPTFRFERKDYFELSTTWVPVTDATSVKAGDRIIIVADNSGKYVLGQKSGDYRAGVQWNGADPLSEGAQIIEVVKAAKPGKLALKVDGGYLYSDGGSTSISTSENLAGASSFVFEKSGNYVAAKFDGTSRYIRFYSSNNDFRSYLTSNGIVAYVYRNDAESVAPEAQTITIYYDNSATNWEQVRCIVQDGENTVKPMTKVEGYAYLWSVEVKDDVDVKFDNNNEIVALSQPLSASMLRNDWVYKCAGDQEAVTSKCHVSEYTESHINSAWQPVGATADIKAGDKIVIVAENGDVKHVMGGQLKSYRRSLEWSGYGNLPTSASILEVSQAPTPGQYKIKAEDGYMYITSATAQNLNADKNEKTLSNFTFEGNNDRVAIKIYDSERYVRYNSASPSFCAMLTTNDGGIPAYVYSNPEEYVAPTAKLTIYFDNSQTNWSSVHCLTSDGKTVNATLVDGMRFLYKAVVDQNLNISFTDGPATSTQVAHTYVRSNYVYSSDASYIKLADYKEKIVDYLTDYYLVLHKNLWDDGNEIAVPFTYKEKNGDDVVYTLDPATVPGSSCKDSNGVEYNTGGTNGFAGEFYIRDGKANHSGKYFTPQTSTYSLRAPAAEGTPEPFNLVDGRAKVNLTLVDNSAAHEEGTVSSGPRMITTAQTKDGVTVPVAIRNGEMTLTVGASPAIEIGAAVITGIESVMADNDENAPAVFYNLQGIRVNPSTAAPGVYIRTQGRTSTKVILGTR